jgi:glycine reductase
MSKVRVMHFLNQFFAGMGGEDRAGVPLDSRKEPLGPGRHLQTLLGESAEIVVTVLCGDNYFPGHQKETIDRILQIAKDLDIKILVAGPAFLAGRFGFACTEICHSVSTSLGLSCVAAMHVENAGVVGYKGYKDRGVFCLPTSEGVQGMADALSRVAKFVLKLAAGSPIGPATEEGYIPRGIRVTEATSKTGVDRAIDMLVAKLAGRPYTTEIPVIREEVTPIAPRITSMKEACLSLVTTSGVVAEGNPEGFKAVSNTRWAKYSIEGFNTMKDGKWDVVHGGYDTVYMEADPNYGVPLDMVRQFETSKELEREGEFARLYPFFYSATGVGGVTSVMQRIGKEIARDMRAEGIDGALLVST